jgi:tRNA-(ms[2]io[6]A)-hydroxylase
MPSSILACSTPPAWLRAAQQDLKTLLTDHANCEMKAASTALGFIYRYPADRELATQMSRLAREELRHFEQVQGLMASRHIEPGHLSAARYAGSLRQAVAGREPDRLLDSLLVGAFIEARSCERFALLCDLVDSELGRFYQGLLASEARHFQVYLALALERASPEYPFAKRLEALAELEAALICQPDQSLRFHSGPPAA